MNKFGATPKWHQKPTSKRRKLWRHVARCSHYYTMPTCIDPARWHRNYLSDIRVVE